MPEAPPLIVAALFAGAGVMVGSILGLVSRRMPADPAVARVRCTARGAAIPWRHPLMAAACALIGAWAALSQHSLPASAMTALLGWQLLLIAVVDGEHFWLPDQLTLPLLATGMLAAALLDGLTLVDAGTGAAAGFILLWLTALAYRRVRGREGLGGGDPFLLAAGGAWVGWAGLPSVLLWAAVSGLSIPAARVLLRRPVSGEDRMPFGVFLALGIWLTWVLGPLGIAR